MGLVKVGCANYIVKCRPRLPYIVGKVHDRNYKDLDSVDFISRGLKSVPTTLLVTELIKVVLTRILSLLSPLLTYYSGVVLIRMAVD